ncbi:MAG: hypothetical protein HY326_07095 [Chloroflexi bacterium]|nr:hypothetical protein [Chloroflexota bacterium]
MHHEGDELEGPAIEDRSSRLRAAALDLAQQHAQVAHQVLVHSSVEPALGLLVHRVPRRQIVAQAWTWAGIMRHCMPVRTM